MPASRVAYIAVKPKSFEAVPSKIVAEMKFQLRWVRIYIYIAAERFSACQEWAFLPK
jgi:hypothetical protein